jgi:hypothetical protein
MEPRGFVAALFDYSFASFVTPRIIKVLYVLATILISVWTLVLVLAAFNASSGFGLLMLLIGGPLFFLIAMIYARVFLELVIVFFRINGNVQEIRDDRSGGALQPAPAPRSPSGEVALVAPASSLPETRREQAVAAATIERAPDEAAGAASSSVDEPASARFCENCGAERRPDGRFCTSCGQA